MDNREILNDFFVKIYNRILTIEENTLSCSGCRDLTVSELHIIDAINKQVKINDNTMSGIARRLSLSAGALSVAVGTLVKKEYLYRETTDLDRRKVYIFLTDKGKEAEVYHRIFHNKMIDGITGTMSESELDMLARSLVCLGKFFEDAENT
jgi:DNA-binding MarR family transcriptional regulator